MIVVLTSVKQGGMPQFAIELFSNLLKIGMDVKLLSPKSENISVDIAMRSNQIIYDLPESIKFKMKITKSMAETINMIHPEEIWFADETTTSLKIASSLLDDIKIRFFIHDANPHVYSFNLKRTLRILYKNSLRENVFKHATHIVLMSQASKNTFMKQYPQFAKKLSVLRLGAHVPIAKEEKPPELNINEHDPFFLFFGTIEKYKNVISLLKAYKNYTGNRKLVIAGKGKLSNDEISLVNNDPQGIILLNRFITDEEMIYLFKHARATILPYIEASQSGVLAMGYYFSLPTIVSNLPGLAENVINDKTGFICNNETDITDALTILSDEKKCIKMGLDARNYLDSNLNFAKNVKKMLSEDKPIHMNVKARR